MFVHYVLQSATISTEHFATYLGKWLGTNIAVPVLFIPGYTFPVLEFYKADYEDTVRQFRDFTPAGTVNRCVHTKQLALLLDFSRFLFYLSMIFFSNSFDKIFLIFFFKLLTLFRPAAGSELRRHGYRRQQQQLC